MKAEINEKGFLTIIGENQKEENIIKAWVSENRGFAEIHKNPADIIYFKFDELKIEFAFNDKTY